MDWVVEWSSGGVAVFGVDLATCNAPHHNFFPEVLDESRKGRG